MVQIVANFSLSCSYIVDFPIMLFLKYPEKLNDNFFTRKLCVNFLFTNKNMSIPYILNQLIIDKGVNDSSD